MSEMVDERERRQAEDAKKGIEWANERMRGLSDEAVIRMARLVEECATIRVTGPLDMCCRTRAEAVEMLAAILFPLKTNKEMFEGMLVQALGPEFFGHGSAAA